jgi:hypothetical protein
MTRKTWFINSLLSVSLLLTGCDGVVLNGTIDSKINSTFLISSMSPTTAKPNDQISIYGMNFSEDLKITVDGAPVDEVDIKSDLITFKLPEGRFGLRDIKVTSAKTTSSAPLLRLASDGTPVLSSSDANTICTSETFYTMEGDLVSGTKECKEDFVPCKSKGQSQCLTSKDFPSISLDTLKRNKKCTTDGETECVTHLQISAADTGFDTKALAIGKTLAAKSGEAAATLSGCNADGDILCIVRSPMKAVKTDGLASILKIGTTIAGIPGELLFQFPDAKYVLDTDSTARSPGKLTLPLAKHVLNGINYGVGENKLSGSMTFPEPSNVLTSSPIYGDPSSPLTPAFAPDYPDPNNVLSTDSVKNVQGKLQLPATKNVLVGQTFGIAGNQSQGSLTLPLPIDVRKIAPSYGVVGELKVPLFDPVFPDASSVLAPETTNGITGTFKLPDPKHVLKAQTYGKPSALSTGTLLLPAVNFVKSDAGVYGVSGNESIPAYSPDFPNKANVSNTDKVDGEFGQLIIPQPATVILGLVYGAGSNSRTGTIKLPDPTKVRSGSGAYGINGNGSNPSYVAELPEKKYVLTSDTVGGVSGTMTLPDQKNVFSNIPFGDNTSPSIGSLTLPPETLVRADAPSFGIASKQEGSFVPDFPTKEHVLSSDQVDSVTGAINVCNQNAQVACLTDSTFRSTDFTDLKAENIKNGIQIAGVTGTYPSPTAPLTGATAMPDLKGFDSTVPAGTYEFFDSTGSRYTGEVRQINVTPVTSIQNFSETGLLYSKVTVAGDPDLIAGKIKSATNLFNVAGNFTSFSYPNCNTDGALGCSATSLFPAADRVNNIKPGNIRAGTNIAGVTGTIPVGEPYIIITEPSGWDDVPNSNTFTITFNAFDSDANSKIDLYFKKDDASNCKDDPISFGWIKIPHGTLYQDSSSYTGDTTSVTQGYYHVCARFSTATPIYAVSGSPVAINITNNCLNPNGTTWQNSRGGCTLVVGDTPITYSSLSTSSMNQAAAVTYCQNSTESGQSDWRLGTRDQLLYAAYADGANQLDSPSVYSWTTTLRVDQKYFIVKNTIVPPSPFDQLYYDVSLETSFLRVRCIR